MQSLQEVSSESKYVLTEPFTNELRHFLTVLESEWRQTTPVHGCRTARGCLRRPTGPSVYSMTS